MAKGNRKLSAVQHFIRHHRPIVTFVDVLDAAEPRPPEDPPRGVKNEDLRGEKKNYAQRLSDAMAVLVATELRPYFPNIMPDEHGVGGESPARTGKGVKRLDVNYSTTQLGLGLGVSIKTLNFRDPGRGPGRGRYTKNPTARDNELRAEAMDYHERQPFAVLAALILVPMDACDDGDPERPKSSSSFAQIIKVFRHRIGRDSHRTDPQLFERGFVGLYEWKGANRGRVIFFDLAGAPPQFGRPQQVYDLKGVVRHIVTAYDARNRVKPPWDTRPDEVVPFFELSVTDEEAEPTDEGDDDV